MNKPVALALILLLGGCAAAPPPAAPPAPPPTPVEASLPTGRAMVSAADPRGTAAGIAILRQGGSAVDAAMAVMLSMTVVEPQSSGIGGGGFLLYHDAATRAVTSYDGREKAPAAATPQRFLGADGKPLDYEDARASGLSVGVPGNIRLMEMAHASHGTLPWKALFQPAIALARDGFQVTASLHDAIAEQQEMLKRSPEARALYFTADGAPLPVGATLINPKLAALLTLVAEQGADAFYKGPAAGRLRATVAAAPRHPTTISAADMAQYKAVRRDPVCGPYRGYRICAMGPPSSGATTVLATLRQLERFDLTALGPDDVRSWHLIGDSMRLAYADRARWLGDADFIAVPVSGLMDAGYIAGRSALIMPDRALPVASAGTPPGAPPLAPLPDPERHGTTHFVVADAAGNVASMTSTVEDIFGSGLIVDGYVLNNELTDFNFEPESDGLAAANRVQPGKRPRSSMAPTIVFDASGTPIAAIGAAGGPTIIAQVAKSLIAMLDWGMDVQSAIALAEFMGSGDGLRIEQGTATAALADRLRAMGHKVTVDDFGGKANGIDRAPDGRWRGGVDVRSEGVAQGLP